VTGVQTCALPIYIYKWRGDMQQILLDSGQETQDTLNAWNWTYNNYVPLQRAEFAEDSHISSGRGGGGRGEEGGGAGRVGEEGRLGGEGPGVEGGAGSLQGAAGGHRRGLCRRPLPMGSRDSVTFP